jgi:VIT1/CCC1 family predicted Fe2+/Mn2+ transporter
MNSEQKQNQKLYLRNFIFGVEDSLVSTIGLVSGIAVAGVDKRTILLTGVILIFVEAFSMGSGSLISEHSAHEYTLGKHQAKMSHFRGAAIMFGSYFCAGFLPLLPYLFFDMQSAFWIAIAVALAALFSLGAINAKKFKVKIISHALEMMIIGGIAIVLGVVVGRLLGQI